MTERRRRRLVVWAALTAFAPPLDANAQASRRGPLDVREEFLPAQPRLTLPSASPDPLAPGETRLRLGLDWGSDFGLKGTDANLTHFVDGEHRTLVADLRHGATPSLTLGARIPLRWRGPGVLDGLIDWWHRASGLPDNDRGLYPRGLFRIEGRDVQGRRLAIAEDTGAGLGNVELSGLWAVRRSPAGRAVSLVGRVELPTGTGAFGGTGVHYGAQAVLAQPLGRTVDLFSGVGATLFARERLGGLEYARTRAHGFATLEWRPGRRLSLLVEASAASRLLTNVADYPGLQMYFRMGAKLDLGARWQVEGGFVEGLTSLQTTTDFGIQAGLSRRF